MIFYLNLLQHSKLVIEYWTFSKGSPLLAGFAVEKGLGLGRIGGYINLFREDSKTR
jgi:hypothetical protein